MGLSLRQQLPSRSVVGEEAKKKNFDRHSLLQKYADSIKSQENFLALYLEAKVRFYELFMSKIGKLPNT